MWDAQGAKAVGADKREIIRALVKLLKNKHFPAAQANAAVGVLPPSSLIGKGSKPCLRLCWPSDVVLSLVAGLRSVARSAGVQPGAYGCHRRLRLWTGGPDEVSRAGAG